MENKEQMIATTTSKAKISTKDKESVTKSLVAIRALCLCPTRAIGGKGCHYLIQKQMDMAQKCHNKVLTQDTLTQPTTVGYNIENETEDAVSRVDK